MFYLRKLLKEGKDVPKVSIGRIEKDKCRSQRNTALKRLEIINRNDLIL